MLDKARAALLASYHRIEAQLHADEIDQRRSLFLEKYAPELLVNLSGSELLSVVHGDGPRTGLFYDLEFADLYAPFGSIGGGSALKFKVYSARDGSGYKRRGAHNLPVSCSEADAARLTCELAASLYDTLLAVDRFRLPDGDPGLWLQFERSITGNSPRSPSRSKGESPAPLLGWAHKVLAICKPDVFSFHHQGHQLANHLVRLGERPADGKSRYLLDRQWRQLRIDDPDFQRCHPALLMLAAYDAFGNETKYWRIGTDEHQEHGQIDRWRAMQQGGYVSIGWNSIGSLQDLLGGLEEKEARERIRRALDLGEEDIHPSANLLDRWASQIYEFYAAMSPGDRVVAMNGRLLQSVGEVTGDYEYNTGDVHPHRRSVTWHDVQGEPWPVPPGRQAILTDFSRRYDDALRVERLLSSSPPNPPSDSQASIVRETPPAERKYNRIGGKLDRRPIVMPLSPFDQRIREILEYKGQVILYGPPGTGKTYHARRSAREIIARETCHGRAWGVINAGERRRVEDSIEFITFHPAYAYEDFVEGYRPVTAQDGAPAFALRDGVFLEVCERARQDSARHFILLIDEINRGDVAAIMGELITLLETDKRGTTTSVLPLSRRRFCIPQNVWIIGAMNTADRSISLLDAALRRRFGFVELLPDPEAVAVEIDGLPLSALLTEINRRIRTHVTRNARELQLGHAYFMRGGKPLGDKETLLAAVRNEVLPLLAEYCFENYAMLARILGNEIIDVAGQIPNSRVMSDADSLHSALIRLLAEESSRPLKTVESPVQPRELEFARPENDATREHNTGRRRTL